MELYDLLFYLYSTRGENMSNSQSVQPLVDTICQHRQMYYRLAYSFMGNEADAMDAISQMTITVLEKHRSLRDPDAFLPWSKKILVNVCRTKLRDKKRTVSLELNINYSDSQIQTEEIETQLLIRKYIAELPLKHREVLVLRFYHDMDYKQISELLGLPLGTVKSRLNRAIATLKERIGGEINE